MASKPPVPRRKDDDHTESAAQDRRNFARSLTNTELTHVSRNRP
jgi:hypothetical protein